VVGVAGLMGAGRTELAMSLFGRSYGQRISGTALVRGEPADLSTVPKAIAAGLAYATEDRKHLGLILHEDVRLNVTLSNLPRVADGGVIDAGRERQAAEDYRTRLAIRCSGVGQATMNLSGGNQQKVVLSKWLFAEPDILMLDEPTRGVDVGAKYEIYTIVNALAAAGKGVLMISSEMPELLGMCDRIYVMNEGRMVGEFTAAEASQEAIMRCIVTSSGGPH
jgi:putative multiple sugar transport system ATP-binding protein